MAGVEWIKLYTDMFEVSRKIKNIEIMQDGDTILIIWIKLLLLAGYVNDGGAIYLTPSIPFTEEGLANELRRPIETVRTALEVFECYDMIEIVDGVIYISSWGKYQNVDKLEEIKAKDRERKRQKRAQAKACQEESVDSPRTVHGQSTEVPCIEEEREEEKENKIEEERGAFAPSFPPSQEEVREYAKERGYATSTADRLFRYYTSTGWKTTARRDVRDWRSKLDSWAEQDERKKDVGVSSFTAEDAMRIILERSNRDV